MYLALGIGKAVARPRHTITTFNFMYPPHWCLITSPEVDEDRRGSSNINLSGTASPYTLSKSVHSSELNKYHQKNISFLYFYNKIQLKLFEKISSVAKGTGKD